MERTEMQIVTAMSAVRGEGDVLLTSESMPLTPALAKTSTNGAAGAPEPARRSSVYGRSRPIMVRVEM